MSAISVDSIIPLGTKLLVRKCCRGDEGLILTTEQYKEHSEFVEVLAIGAKCKVFQKEAIGGLVQCPEFAEKMHAIDEKGEYWIVDESILPPMFIVA